ncbi:platelet glycoprotein Ib alpha chain-like [Cynara cardunculus var. scolymus]|uniref:platelet glycoprotein Ib alpha chain-like n=1 Tax=Cynara cardunculus var. scolymus TaxID=59895 RepID=UPI000D627B72|nr:platelet glycoprotein Ib alpha chain-like [Cynara cardunculus var. scolymus]
MADILLKENQELRAKYDELEKNYKLQKYVNEKCNESLHRGYNEKIERIVKEFEHKIETVENNWSLDRKSYNDELEKWISSNANLSTKLELVKTALIAERHSQSNNSDTKDLTDKFHKTENELTEFRRLFELEKEKTYYSVPRIWHGGGRGDSTGTPSPSTATPTPSTATPSRPTPTPSTATPSRPTPTPSTATPSRPTPTPSTATPSRPIVGQPTPTPSTATPSRPIVGQPTPTPSTATPSRPIVGQPTPTPGTATPNRPITSQPTPTP